MVGCVRAAMLLTTVLLSLNHEDDLGGHHLRKPIEDFVNPLNRVDPAVFLWCPQSEGLWIMSRLLKEQ